MNKPNTLEAPEVYRWTGPTGVNFTQKREPSGTYYHVETPRAVIDSLERAMDTGARLRLFVGDPKTGRDWCEEFEVCGTVGRSMGPIKIPLLIKTPRSTGGGAIMDDNILRIMCGRCEWYRHPKYQAPIFRIVQIGKRERCGKVNLRSEGYTHGVERANEIGQFNRQANFKSEQKAKNYIAFMLGERLAK